VLVVVVDALLPYPPVLGAAVGFETVADEGLVAEAGAVLESAGVCAPVDGRWMVTGVAAGDVPAAGFEVVADEGLVAEAGAVPKELYGDGVVAGACLFLMASAVCICRSSNSFFCASFCGTIALGDVDGVFGVAGGGVDGKGGALGVDIVVAGGAVDGKGGAWGVDVVVAGVGATVPTAADLGAVGLGGITPLAGGVDGGGGNDF